MKYFRILLLGSAFLYQSCDRNPAILEDFPLKTLLLEEQKPLVARVLSQSEITKEWESYRLYRYSQQPTAGAKVVWSMGKDTIHAWLLEFPGRHGGLQFLQTSGLGTEGASWHLEGWQERCRAIGNIFIRWRYKPSYALSDSILDLTMERLSHKGSDIVELTEKFPQVGRSVGGRSLANGILGRNGQLFLVQEYDGEPAGITLARSLEKATLQDLYTMAGRFHLTRMDTTCGRIAFLLRDTIDGGMVYLMHGERGYLSATWGALGEKTLIKRACRSEEVASLQE